MSRPRSFATASSMSTAAASAEAGAALMASPRPAPTSPAATAHDDYANLLQSKQQAGWKRLLRVQAPYQWYLRRQDLGRTIEIGCGVGRNLGSLAPGSVGVDHNVAAVRIVREMGLTAMTSDEWQLSPLRRPAAFDGLLFSHLLEHVDETGALEILRAYLPCLRPGGRVLMICPQERGYASDATHVRFTDGVALTRLAEQAGLRPEPWVSFPFPRWAGRFFIYNEFCLRAVKPD